MPHAEVNGQRLYYEVTGEGDPLLLVMGLAGDTVAWALQVGEWSKTHRVIAFDNRDVGQSSYADGPYEIADMASDTLALADHLELDTFHLVGLSMGGMIAQEIALRAPERAAHADARGDARRRRPLRPGEGAPDGRAGGAHVEERSASTTCCS